ncbi:unnamed protein product [Penicillium glandicola]
MSFLAYAMDITIDIIADEKIWFPGPIQKRKILTLEDPTSSNWKVLHKINEHVEQWHTSGPCLASAKFICHDARVSSKGPTAFLRVVQQIPYVRADVGPLRAPETTKFTHPELKAYKALKQRNSPNTPKLLAWQEGTQDSSGLVPGGFITWFIFENIEGLALGDENGAGPYWALPPETRTRIPEVFLKEYNTAAEVGILPVFEGPGNLIWNEKRETMYVSHNLEEMTPC